MPGEAPRTLIIFAREPNEHTSKTRLAPLFDGPARVQFYTAMLRDIAEASRSAQCDRRILMWAPEPDPKLLADVFDDHALTPQRGEGLGARMGAAFADAFASEPSAHVVLIGSDAPLLDAPALDSAYELLEQRDIVLAPSCDGGYCLVGARAGVGSDVAALFDGMRWSAPDVFAETIERVERLAARRPGVTCGILPMCHDIDTPDDVLRLERRLESLDLAGQPLPRHTLDALRRLT
jgi:uncharacterized protein